jgi:hypothetical protein
VKFTTSAEWAQREFSKAKVKDPRWVARLVSVAAQAARRPAGKVTEVFGNDADRQGAYGLLASEEVARGESFPEQNLSGDPRTVTPRGSGGASHDGARTLLRNWVPRQATRRRNGLILARTDTPHAVLGEGELGEQCL